MFVIFQKTIDFIGQSKHSLSANFIFSSWFLLFQGSWRISNEVYCKTQKLHGNL